MAGKLTKPVAPRTLIVTASPHIEDQHLTVQRVMVDVLIALVPTMLVTVYYFGLRPLAVVGVAVAAAMLAEAACQRIMRIPIRISDGSAAITGVLLAMNVPPGSPIWLAAMGSVIAIVFAKMLFGGLGYNIFNPALIGRATLLAAWPVAMTKGWLTPFWWREHGYSFFSMNVSDRLGAAYDAISSATPLIKGGQAADPATYLDLFLGAHGGCVGETSVIALLFGGLYLIYRGHVYWQNPVSYIVTTALLTWAFSGTAGLFTGDWLYHVLAGGLILGAFFMSTDMVTCPMTVRGQVIFGIGCGFFTWLIRWKGGPAEGVSYGILLMNAATPLIDRYTVPRIFGQDAGAAA